MVNVSNPMSAASAYSNTAKQATGSALGETDTTSTGGGASFGKMLEGAIKSSIDTVKSAEAASAAAVTGKANLLDVTQAVTAAKLTLETTVAVRDNVVDAYNKIMQMPI